MENRLAFSARRPTTCGETVANEDILAPAAGGRARRLRCIAVPVVIVAAMQTLSLLSKATHIHTTPVGEAANTEVVTEPVFLVVVVVVSIVNE